jgi:hypothetical protein
MSRAEAKAKGLRVFLSMYRCRMSSKHSQWRVVSSNRCTDCVELEANLRKGLKASLLDRLRAEAERKVRKEMASVIAEAERQARDIVKAAEKAAMDRAKVLEKAKATLAANRARKAAEAAATGPGGQAAGAAHAPPWEGPEEASGASMVDDSAPWD